MAAKQTMKHRAGIAEQSVGELLRIEEVAKRTGLTKRTLRYYEERGLLDAPPRTEGNYRLYTQADVEHILRVKRMRELLGASLEEIKEMVAGEEARHAFREEWERATDPAARLDLLDRAEAVVRRQLAVVAVRLTELRELESALQQKLERFSTRRGELQALSRQTADVHSGTERNEA